MSHWRQLALPGIAALVCTAILVSLGVWQLYRLQWKEALIASVESRLGAPPVPAPPPAAWPELVSRDLEYQPVTVHGRFLNDKEADVVYSLTEPKGPLGGPGYLVMTPFATDDGWIVYVDRGFVPKERKDPATRKEGLIEGETAVTGLFRSPHGRAWYMPGDGISDNQWFSRDPKLFAAARGLPVASVAPYLIDAGADAELPGGLPQGGETIVEFPNNHLQYALTWFGLALGLIGVFVVFARGRLRANRDDRTA